MDLRKAWAFLKSEPREFVRELAPRGWHELNKKSSAYTRGVALYPPQRLLVALTTRCDLRCKMCPLWGEEGLWFKETPEYFKGDLGWEDLERLAEAIGPFRTAVILTGGEPLITKHWYDFAKRCRSFGCRVFMATGATLLERRAEQVLEVIDHLQVSFDGSDASIHDRNRGTEGSFERVVAGLRKVDLLKKRRGLKKPFINICHTITDENYLHLVDFLDFVSSLQVQVHEVAFQHLEFTDEKTLQRHRKFYQHYFQKETNFWEGFLFCPKDCWDTDRLLGEVRRVQQYPLPSTIERVLFRPDLTLEEAKVFYRSGYKLPERYDRKCLAPWEEAFIMPNGDVWTCPDYIAGNIRQDSFLKIWNGVGYRRLREVLNQTATMPACKSCASLYVHS